MWRIELAGLDGAPLGQPAWRALTIDRALNGGTVVACRVDNDNQAATYARLGLTTLRVWDGDALRFHGRLREPLVASPGVLALTAGSPYTLLDRRQATRQLIYTAADQGAIIADVLGEQNVRSPTGLRVAPFPLSVARDREYEVGKSVQEIIAQLAAVEGGPYFVERPILDRGTPAVLAELVLRWPAPGEDRPGVRFEYGEGTLANLDGYSLTELLPLNRVVVSGAAPPPPEGEEPGPVPVATVEDAASIATYRLFEVWLSDPDVDQLATLTEKATARLRPDPTTLVEVSPVASGPAAGGVPVPRMWDDFDLGDTVYVTVRDETTEAYDLALTVVQARLTISEDDDSERLELTLQTPGEDVGA